MQPDETGSGPTGCWRCDRLSADPNTCAWCGVWLRELNPANVPPSLRHLLPAAREWGIGDDFYRAHRVMDASVAELRWLVQLVRDVPDEAWDWLVGPEADRQPVSDEYAALTCLTMAYDYARTCLDRRST